MTSLGEIGIGQIPQVKREDKFKTNFPLASELIEAVKNSDYVNPENPAHQLVSHLAQNGGEIYFSHAAIEAYGKTQVYVSYDYYTVFSSLSIVDYDTKIAVMAWIADNIFDIEKMSLKKAEEEGAEE